ncbi:AI-2E family transporter, partial [Myxococcota bacterium]|nr:AI-2E family transporter [Myxococcota bacterium]
PDSGTRAASPQLIRSAVEVAIRLGAIALLVGWCLVIVAPFLGIVVWALIIAIALDEPFSALARGLGGRKVLAAVLVVALGLSLVFGPAVYLSDALVSGAQQLAHDLKGRPIAVPPPRAEIREIPILGPIVFDAWQHASENLAETVTRLHPQLRTVSGWLLEAAGKVGAGILELIASIVIAGVMLVQSELRGTAIARFSERMAGSVRGPHLAGLATATVRSVVQGILGVAALQSFLAGTAFVVAGIPGAGLWALLVLVAAVVQAPVALAMAIPVVIGFSTLSMPAAIALAVWCAVVGLVDNVLKPILFGRGAKVPALVIFMGAIGGLLSMGIVGLFLGSVVLALGYELFLAWLEDGDAPAAGGPAD